MSYRTDSPKRPRGASMHDIKKIREMPENFDSGLIARGLSGVSSNLIELDVKLRNLKNQLQKLQEIRNTKSKCIGKASKENNKELLVRLKKEVVGIKTQIHNLEDEEKNVSSKLNSILESLPNTPDVDVPIGSNETMNKQIRNWGNETSFTFTPLEHDELGSKLGLMNFEQGAKLSGSRFVVLHGALARLERALGNFMIDVHTKEFDYTEVAPPFLVRSATAYGTGNLPKFADDLFQTEEGFFLIPTAEMPLTNLVSDEILDSSNLPLRYTAFTQCFRSEAGAAGRDTRGMIRQHQFGKVELVSITSPDESESELDRMTDCAETILKRLGLPYRVMLLSTGDMGFSAAKTYDLEVWLPGQSNYREISSCSNCRSFQARRMKARFKRSKGKPTEYLHTLNGSGVAVGRALVAILENYQNSDGSITIPNVLREYMGGVEKIG